MLSQKISFTALLFGIIKAVKEESNMFKVLRVLVGIMYLFTNLSILELKQKEEKWRVNAGL